MRTKRNALDALRKTAAAAGCVWTLLAVAGCSSGSGAKCLNPQPLPPFCGLEPEPLPPATPIGADIATNAAPDAGARTSQCRWPESLNDGGPGACSMGRSYVECTSVSGAGCDCLSDDPTSCSGCGPGTGSICRNACEPNEYAVSCGGPPRPVADGGLAFDYESAPAGCRLVATTPSGSAYWCCPCE